jgi:hypothetical protein
MEKYHLNEWRKNKLMLSFLKNPSSEKIILRSFWPNANQLSISQLKESHFAVFFQKLHHLFL